MGHKKVCLDCSISFNRDYDGDSEIIYPCPECGKPMTLLPHRFRPPKKTDYKKWATVKFLVSKGFYYQHIWEPELHNGKIIGFIGYVKYPDNLRDAKEFVLKYKKQALK